MPIAFPTIISSKCFISLFFFLLKLYLMICLVNFRCESSTQCVPSFSNPESTNLPEEGTTFRVPGRCVSPCSTCTMEDNPQCGADGRTYQNHCFLDCVNVQVRTSL